MFQAYVLSVLASLGASSSDALRASRVAAYRRVPVGLRGAVRTRVTRAVSDAIFATRHGGDEPHVHRLAYLTLLSREGTVSADDVDAVAVAFERARQENVERERPSTARTIALGAVMLLAPVALVAWWLWPSDPYAALHESLPPSRGAYVEGGRPDPGGAAQRELFATHIPELTVALDRWRALRGGPDEPAARAAVDAALATTLEAARGALGADAQSFLRAVLEQSIAIVGSPDAIGRHAAESHVRSVDALDAALQAEGLAYYVDAEVLSERATGASRVYLSSFTVENVAIYEAEGHTVRALRLRRLDTLNFARAVLGFTRPQVRDALVLGERVEEHLVQAIVPALAEDGALALSSATDRALFETTEHAAASGVREDASRWFADGATPGESLGALLAQRHAIFDTWSQRLDPRGITLREPPTYVLDLEPYRGVLSALTPAERRDLGAIGEALESEQHQRTYRAIEARFSASIERHEVQHRLDFMMGTLGTMPPALEARVGPLRQGDLVNRLAERANAELSAYTSELAREATLARANLALLARYVFDRQLWGTAECHAALLILEGLGDRMGIAHGPLVVSRAIDRTEAARLYEAIVARPSDELRAAAQALWQLLYSRELPALRSTARATEVWRE